MLEGYSGIKFNSIQMVYLSHISELDQNHLKGFLTSRGTGRTGPLYEWSNYCSSTGGRTYRGISLSRKMQQKKVFCLQPLYIYETATTGNSYYASWFTEIIVLLLGQSILLTSKYYTYLFCFWGKFLSEREEDQL